MVWMQFRQGSLQIQFTTRSWTCYSAFTTIPNPNTTGNRTRIRNGKPDDWPWPIFHVAL